MCVLLFLKPSTRGGFDLLDSCRNVSRLRVLKSDVHTCVYHNFSTGTVWSGLSDGLHDLQRISDCINGPGNLGIKIFESKSTLLSPSKCTRILCDKSSATNKQLLVNSWKLWQKRPYGIRFQNPYSVVRKRNKKKDEKKIVRSHHETTTQDNPLVVLVSHSPGP